MKILCSYLVGFIFTLLANFFYSHHVAWLGSDIQATVLLTLSYGTMIYFFFCFLNCNTLITKNIVISWALGLLAALVFVILALAIFNKQYNIDSAIYLWIVFSGIICNYFFQKA